MVQSNFFGRYWDKKRYKRTFCLSLDLVETKREIQVPFRQDIQRICFSDQHLHLESEVWAAIRVPPEIQIVLRNNWFLKEKWASY